MIYVYIPNIYIITKLLSVANPDTNRHIANAGTLAANIVAVLPTNAVRFDRIKIGSLPGISINS